MVNPARLHNAITRQSSPFLSLIDFKLQSTVLRTGESFIQSPNINLERYASLRSTQLTIKQT